ncbi:hypothetical protein LTR27_008397 [Elasticomyces elasticus]|nr:hypothetical protein LTR27_008397 [Elasticomyces elasticus]
MSGKDLPEDHLDAAVATLDSLTTTNPDSHSKTTTSSQLQTPADSKKSHTLFRSVFPYDSLQDFEAEWHLGNYIIDRQTSKKTFEPMPLYVRLGMHLLYYGTPEATALHWKRTQDLLKAQSLKMGKQYDDPKSRDHIKPFIDSFELQESLKEMKEPDFTKYRTFNAFFGREIRDDARPQASPQDLAVVTSPADCRLTAFSTVDLATKYWIKGTGFALPKLLASDSLAQKMDGGSLVIARLAPQDYHRWHAPISGTVESIVEVPGTYYTVNPQAITQEGTLDVFCENRRSVMVVRRSPTSAPAVIIAVGAMLVGSIKYNDGVKVGAEIKRGQCLGAFYYGGSTVIVVYPKGEIKLDEDLVKNSMEQQLKKEE